MIHVEGAESICEQCVREESGSGGCIELDGLWCSVLVLVLYLPVSTDFRRGECFVTC